MSEKFNENTFSRKNNLYIHNCSGVKYTLFAMKKWPYMRGNNLVVFYYLNAFKIWADKKCDLWLERPHQRGRVLY
jgi:hypothetical protein